MTQLTLPFEKTVQASAAPSAGRSPVRLSDRQFTVRRIRARFDSADTSDNNRRHWARADALSADAATSADVRRILRNRARYEVANNSYARGIVLTLANDTVGTGPRLQMLSADQDLNRRVERDFHLWSQAVNLPEKLRTLRMARAQDGEGFGIIVTNPAVEHPVRLDLQLIEADQVTSSVLTLDTDDEVDGVRLDAFGNPVAYRVLKMHPGGVGSFLNSSVLIPAGSMVHVFRMDRPGQHRGIPEITPALPLFAQLRRFTLAVLSAAEAAADFAGILYTDAPANGEADELEPMDKIKLDRNTLLTMPGGWKMDQVDPKQPATTYAEFKKEILNEIARCLNMPFNIAAGNSSGYNYASGRLDHQTYFKSIRVDQAYLGTRVLDRILGVWLLEWALVNGFPRFEQRRSGGTWGTISAADFAPTRISSQALTPMHTWFWDGFEHVDPAKEANAQETRLRNHTTTLAHEFGRQGKDWEVELRQRGKEIALLRELGLDATAAAPVQPVSRDDNQSEE